MPVKGTYDVIIIGGGACGCTTAYFLAKEGLTVALLDKGEVGREASWASAGMIGPTSAPGANPWYLQSTTLSKTLYDTLDGQLFEETGQRIGYGGEGALHIAITDAESRGVEQQVSAQASDGVTAQMLTGEEAKEREPSLPDGIQAAAWLVEDRFLDARTYTAVISLAARARGVSVFEGFPATGLVWEKGRITGVQSGSDTFQSAVVINAAGAWAGQLDPQLTHPVTPLHGQIMSLSGKPGGLRHNLMRAGQWGYATPRSDGRIVIGATEDTWGYQKKITADGMTLLGIIVRNLLPSLANHRVLDIWSGLRPATPDGLPAIGPDPRVKGGYLWAAGHTASGMMQMPATASVLTDLVLDREPQIAIQQVRIDRFLREG